tara:strand:- start:1241 stop:1723 length:483 start_codon:yes stop_codon:yes gene_type:complete
MKQFDVTEHIRAIREDIREQRKESKDHARIITELTATVSNLSDRVNDYREQCRGENDAIIERLDNMSTVKPKLVTFLDEMTISRMATLVGLCMLAALTVGGSWWVAQTGKLPTEFHHVGHEAQTQITEEERAERKASAREAVIELLQGFPGADAEQLPSR